MFLNNSQQFEQTEQKKVNCQVCSFNLSKYKCPKCKIQYCAVQCFKTHQCQQQQTNDKCDSPDEQDLVPRPLYLDKEEDIVVPKSKLELLKKSKKIKHLVSNKFIQGALTNIIKSSNPFKVMSCILKKDETFREFYMKILKKLKYLDKNNQFEY